MAKVLGRGLGCEDCEEFQDEGLTGDANKKSYGSTASSMEPSSHVRVVWAFIGVALRGNSGLGGAEGRRR